MADVIVAPEIQQTPPPPEAPKRVETVSAKEQFDLERKKIESDASQIRSALVKTVKDSPDVDFKPEQDEFLDLSRQLEDLGQETTTELGLQTKVEGSGETKAEEIDTSGLVERKLQPGAETDNAGFERKIYTINGVTFSFRGKEELPIYPTVENSRTHLLGESPSWVSQEDYQTYQDQIKKTETQVGSPEHYLANKTLLGVVELAIQLGSQDSSLVQIKDELSKGIYSSKALEVMDGLIALNYIDHIRDPNNAKYLPSPSPDAEAVMVMALLGDQEAKTAVSQKVEEVKQLDAERKAKEAKEINGRVERTGAEPLKTEELVSVHATKYKPEIGSQGELIVRTSFDATEGRDVRNSIHTALNHKVESHMYGSWGEAGYVLISPFESMVKANGVPTVLNTVDTWWARNPGESLIFPDATLVAPGGDKVSGLFEIRGNTIEFKSAGLDRNDLIAVADYLETNGKLVSFADSINRAFFKPIDTVIPDDALEGTWNLEALNSALENHLFKGRPDYGDSRLLVKLTAKTEGQTISLEDKIKEIIESPEASTALNPGQNKDVAVTNLSKKLADNIRVQIFSQINEIAVQEGIKSREFKVQSGGMWAWEDRVDITDQTAALAKQLGTDYGAHSGTPQQELTENVARAIYNARGDSNRFNWEMYNNPDYYNPRYDELVSQLDPKTRRVLYTSGLLTARS